MIILSHTDVIGPDSDVEWANVRSRSETFAAASTDRIPG